MNSSNYFFQLSLDEAARFIRECVQQSLEHAMHQGQVLLGTDSTPPKQDRLLTTDQVCQMLGITRLTCDTWRKAGKLPYERIGARVYFYEQQVHAALQLFKRRRKS